jgi:hypothetical protein
MWEREHEFQAVLASIGKKATKDLLDLAAELAVADDKFAYKAVCGLIVREMKRLKPHYRVRLFYLVSSVVRRSISERGLSKDKYGACSAYIGTSVRHPVYDEFCTPSSKPSL